MDFSAALPTFFITLREGVEAALVVGIVLALLKKAKQSYLNNWVYAGIGVGIALSGMVGVLFGWLIQTLGTANPKYQPVVEPLLEGVFNVFAIAMLSWMLIWMTKQARFMKAQVEGAVTSALTNNANAGWGIFSLILIAVLREGFESVFLIISYFQQGIFPAIGSIAGLVVAALIGVLLFKWGVKINIRQFFQVMGIFLVLIVAGLVVTALHLFDNATFTLSRMDRASESLCFFYERFAKNPSCILGPMVWNTSKIMPEDQFPGVILKALFGYRQHIYIVQAVAYFAFLLTVGGIYLRSITGGSSAKPKSKPVAENHVSRPE